MTRSTHTPGTDYAQGTFGEIAATRHLSSLETYQQCAFCKKQGYDTPLAMYSTRRHVCKPCALARADHVLPSVLKHLAFEKKMDAVARPQHERCLVCHVVNGHKEACVYAINAEMAAVLRDYIANFTAFRSKPVGAPNSEMRVSQDAHIAVEDKARAIIAKLEAQS